MKKCALYLIAACSLAATAWAADPAGIVLEKPNINIHDSKAIERGAQHFVTFCYSCHTLNHLTFDPIADKFNISVENNPSGALVQSMATPPPDLSLITRTRGANWVYTYLYSYYKDDSQLSGSNNLLLQNTSMPNMLQALQGEQILKDDMYYLDNYRLYDRTPHWFELLETVTPGSISPAEFDLMITDLVTFLSYSAEPKRAEREKLGWWVLGFLAIFIFITYRLKKEYWKDIK